MWMYAHINWLKIGAILLVGVAFLWLVKLAISPPLVLSSDETVPAERKITFPHDAHAPKTLALKSFQNFQNEIPEYLRGTKLRGGYPVDADNQLIPHLMIKQRFDYFFLMVGDRPFDEIVTTIQGDIYSQLIGDAQTQALALLEQYCSFLVERNELVTGRGANYMNVVAKGDLLPLLHDIEQLQIRTFGELLARRWFEEEVWLQRQSMRQSEERTDNENGVAQTITTSQQQTLAFEINKDKQRRLLGEEPEEQALTRFRIEEYGREAASRLRALDLKRAKFRESLQWVKSFRQTQRNNGLSKSAQRTALIEALKDQGESAIDIKRLLTLSELR